ncbi:Structural maintenance of chromosomes protein 4 [Batrachochytrium dendrobatidis]
MLSHIHPSDSPQVVTEQETLPRLVISKIVQRNFKSYAGIIEIGPFHKSFTSIVGPNGSGKSNVIDSLLFVFGFKAKKLRQGKLSDLIHNSATYPNLTSCAVEVHFQEIIDLPGPDAYDVVPNSQIVVSRVVEKSDQGGKKSEKSIYYINGRTSSYTQATQLLKGKGIDLDHKRFLILQGEVESIALMKPKAMNEHEDGLLEYLEDIIETSHYKQAIDDSSKILEECSQEREEKLQRLKIIQGEKETLEDKKQDALEYIQTENMIAFYKNQIYQHAILNDEQDISNLTTQLGETKEQVEQEKTAFSTLTIEAESLEKTYKKRQQGCKELEEQAKSAKNDLQKFDRAEIELKEKERHLNQKRKKLSKSLEQDAFKQTENSTWVGNFQHDLDKAHKEAESLNRQLQEESASLESIRQSLQGKTDGFQKQIEALQLQLVPWNEKIDAAQAELGVSTSELSIVKEKLNERQHAIESATAAVTSYEQSLEVKDQEMIRIKQELHSEKIALAKTESALQTTKDDQTNANLKVAAARQKCNDTRAALQSAESRNSIHKSLMRESECGNIPGICGRLGDLGVIDDKYDIAITTACGALDSIIVETVEAGQKCIEHLKRYSLGKATFICLDKLRNWDMSPIATPENVPRLFDLVKPKEKRFAPAFYQVLSDTLVAINLEHANRIAYGKKRFRTVTLDGQLVEKSGAMTGGGSRPQRGGMSSKYELVDSKEVSPTKLIEFEKIYNDAEIALREIILKIQKLEARQHEQTKTIQDLTIQLSKLDIDVQSIQIQLQDAKSHLETTQNLHGPSTKDIERASTLETATKHLQSKLETYQQSAAVFEQKRLALQEEILDIGGIKLRSQKAKVESISDQIEAVSCKITKLQAEKGSREASIRKLDKSIAKNEIEISEIDGEINETKEIFQKQMNAAQAVKLRIQEAQKHLNDSVIELEEMTLARDEVISRLNSSRSDQVELKAKLTELAQTLTVKQRNFKSVKESLEKLSLQLTGFENEEDIEELPKYSSKEIANLDVEHAKAETARLEAKLKKMMPKLGVLNEYRVKMELYMSRTNDLDAITAKRDAIKQAYDDLRKRRLEEFMAGFTIISQKLKEMYQMITMGGNAELELVDSLDPFSEGVIFSVMPPKKSWKNIANLSGGEKTLSSLALVFALHHFKPTPLYVMDEIDAALDFRNVSIVANYIKQRTKNAQFIIISLRNNMFELADRLVGVYKTNDGSKSVTIDPRRIAMETAAH